MLSYDTLSNELLDIYKVKKKTAWILYYDIPRDAARQVDLAKTGFMKPFLTPET